VEEADSRQAISAKTTASGSDPPAYAAPAGIEAAIAAPGAMSVIDWKSTSRSPMASRRSPACACCATVPVAIFRSCLTGAV
jgi:hypothetical protein